MEYLLEYGFSSEELQKIYDNIDYVDWRRITSYSSTVCDVLDYLISKDISHDIIFRIFMENPGLFFNNRKEITSTVHVLEAMGIMDFTEMLLEPCGPFALDPKVIIMAVFNACSKTYDYEEFIEFFKEESWNLEDWYSKKGCCLQGSLSEAEQKLNEIKEVLDNREY